MSIIFQDNFVEAADTNLTAHTPNVGTAWVQVAITGTAVIKIFAATDDVGGSASAASNGQYLKSTPAPATADVDVGITCSTIDGGSTNARKVRLHARGNGTTDYYAVRFSPPAAAVNDVELVKVVGGTLTSLASVDTGIVNGDVFVFECRDAAKRVLKNGVQILTSADNTITAAGDCGISMGQVSAGDTGNIAGAWRWDTYSVTEVTGGTTYNDAGEGDLIAVGSAADAETMAEAGQATSAASASAADALTLVEAGQATSAATGSGSDVAALVDAGQASSAATIGAEDVLIVVEAGQASSALVLTGADAWVMADAGGGVLVAVAGGAESGAAPVGIPIGRVALVRAAGAVTQPQPAAGRVRSIAGAAGNVATRRASGAIARPPAAAGMVETP